MTNDEYLKTLVKGLHILKEDPKTPFSQSIAVYLDNLKKQTGKMLTEKQSKERVSNIEDFFRDHLQENLDKFGVTGNISQKNKGFIDFLDDIISKGSLN